MSARLVAIYRKKRKALQTSTPAEQISHPSRQYFDADDVKQPNSVGAADSRVSFSSPQVS
jgi:hypothetical protein